MHWASLASCKIKAFLNERYETKDEVLFQCWMDDFHVDIKSRRLVPSRPVTGKVQMRSEEMERTNIRNLNGQRPAYLRKATKVTPGVASSANSIWQLICDVCNSLLIFQLVH